MYQRKEITRADFEAHMGLPTDPFTIGTCVYSNRGELLVEYLFVEASREVEILEALYALQ